jgi:hypothetical protein
MIKYKIGKYFRIKRLKIIKKIINKIFDQKGSVNIIDIGGAELYWELIENNFLESRNVKITLLNLHDYNVKNKNIFTYVKGNACALKFNDNEFDLSFSNSVIEHVGSYHNMVKFADEIKRVAKVFYCQTPNIWFPLEAHSWFPFFQFMPDPLKFYLVTKFNLGYYKRQDNYIDAIKIVTDAKLLSRKLLFSFFKNEGKITNEKFLFFNKSLIITNGI